MNTARSTQLLDRQGTSLSPLTHLESLFYDLTDTSRGSLFNIMVFTNPSTSFVTGTPSSNAIISYVTINTSATFGTTSGLIELRAEQYNFGDLLTRSQGYINLNSSIQGLNSSIQDLQEQISSIGTGGGSGQVDIEQITESVLQEVNSQLPGLIYTQLSSQMPTIITNVVNSSSFEDRVEEVVSDISVNVSIIAAYIPAS